MVVEVASEGRRWRCAQPDHTCSMWGRHVDPSALVHHMQALAEVGRSSAVAVGWEGGEHTQRLRRGEHNQLVQLVLAVRDKEPTTCASEAALMKEHQPLEYACANPRTQAYPTLP